MIHFNEVVALSLALYLSSFSFVLTTAINEKKQWTFLNRVNILLESSETRNYEVKVKTLYGNQLVAILQARITTKVKRSSAPFPQYCNSVLTYDAELNPDPTIYSTTKNSQTKKGNITVTHLNVRAIISVENFYLVSETIKEHICHASAILDSKQG